MNTAIERLQSAQKHTRERQPKAGGFPYLAETLRQVGVRRNIWTLPACQSVYLMKGGAVVQQGKPLVENIADIPSFNK